jgi:hypothetical protein
VADGQIIVPSVSIKPSITATGVNDDLFDQYGEAIGYGARARLMSMKDKPYSDLKLAGIEQLKFNEKVGQVQVDVARAFSKAPLRTKPMFM